MYEISQDKVRWKGRPIKGADASSFEILTSTIGRDASAVYVIGKATKVDRQSFKILSKSYARDHESVYLIMETKLKAIKTANSSTFTAIGESFGRDGHSAYFRSSRMRLNKGRTPDDLKSLGYIYATDGLSLFFGTERHALPEAVDGSLPDLKLKWFSDNEVNLPILSLTDGARCWIAIYHKGKHWWECEGADFESLAPVAFDNDSLWQASYAKDKARVWFYGTLIADADPLKVRMFGENMLTDGDQIWHGSELIAPKAADISYISSYSTRIPNYMSGTLVHHGDRLVLYELEKDTSTLATRGEDKAGNRNRIVTDSLREIFTTQFAIFTHFPALVNGPSTILQKLKEAPERYIKLDAVPPFEARLDAEGEVSLTLSDGRSLKQPLSAWYTLGCHLWCLTQHHSHQFLPYPPLGVMLPNSTDMHVALASYHRSAMWRLIGTAYEEGHETEARILAHFCFFFTFRHRDPDIEMLQELVEIPRQLMDTFRYDIAHHTFEVTTNLAVGRLIVRDGWLEADDFRDRLDVLDVLHGAILETNKVGIFFEEIIPKIMARYESEPLPAVREHLAMVLEAVLIRGQVDGEVSRVFHHEAMLPVIEFCIAKDINNHFNQARLAEALWALGRTDEAQTISENLIRLIGETAHLPDIYCHRFIYRTPRLWFLRSKINVAQRKADLATHKKRLAEIEKEYENLIARYGAMAAKWEEMKAIKSDINRYREALEQS